MTDRPFLAETCTLEGHVPQALEHKVMRFSTYSEAEDWALSHIVGNNNAVNIFRLEPIAVVERTISVKMIDRAKVNGLDMVHIEKHDTESEKM